MRLADRGLTDVLRDRVVIVVKIRRCHHSKPSAVV